MRSNRVVQTKVQEVNDTTIQIFVYIPNKFDPILRQTFPDIAFSECKPTNNIKWEYLDIPDVKPQVKCEITQFCEKMNSKIILENTLDQCFALDYRMESETGYRTELGQLVRDSKPYYVKANDTHRENSKKLAKRYLQFIQDHPLYRKATYIIAVPASLPLKDFNLPVAIVDELITITGRKAPPAILSKTRITKSMKNSTIAEKKDNIQGSFAIEGPRFLPTDSIIIIDDLYGGGTTIDEVGRILRSHGAEIVFGLTATKNKHDE